MAKINTTLFGELQILEFQPEVPIRERVEWLTDITESEDGTEERKKLRSLPRRFFDYIFPLTQLKKASGFNALYGKIVSDWAIPLWTEGQFVGALSSGASSITCNTTSYDLQDASLALVFDSSLNWEVVEITTAGATSITLDGTLANSFLNAYLLPVRLGFIKNSISLDSNSFESTVKLTFQLEETTNFPTTSAPDQFQDYDVYHDAGLMQNGKISKKISTRIDYNDFEIGSVTRYTPWSNARISSFYNFELDGQTEVNNFKTWLFRRSGKYLSFWLPTFESDLRVKSTGPITTQILVESDSLIDSGSSRTNISVLDSSGTWTDCQITDYTQVTSSTVRITLDTDLSLDASEIVQISWLGLNRFDSDSITLDWIGNNIVNVSVPIVETASSIINLNYIELNDGSFLQLNDGSFLELNG